MTDYLEIQHLIGFTGTSNATFVDSSHIAYPIGSQLIIASLDDQHDQVFIHPQECLDVSNHQTLQQSSSISTPNRILNSSGKNSSLSSLTSSTTNSQLQLGSKSDLSSSNITVVTCSKKFLVCSSFESICVYNLQSKSLFVDRLPFQTQVRSLHFSEDDCFLIAATSTSCWIWSVSNDGELLRVGTLDGNSVVYDERESGFCIAKWLPLTSSEWSKKRRTYEFFVHSRDRGVEKFIWIYDSRSMQYLLEGRVRLQLPGRIASLKRSVSSAVTFRDSQEQAWIVIGTDSGETMIYNATTNVYRAAIATCSGGVTSMQILNVSPGLVEIVVGGGDGTIRVVRGLDSEWRVYQHGSVNGRVTSVSILNDALLCGMDNGSIYLFSLPILNSSPPDLTRVSTKTLMEGTFTNAPKTTIEGMKLKSIISESHLSSVQDVSFSPTSNDYFVTCGNDGTLRRWDLNDYSMTHIFFAPKGVKFLKCIYFTEDEIITGGSDGFIRSYSLSKKDLKWQIVNSHRGGVTALVASSLYICSGGEDACIRLWSPSTRELIGQFNGEHTKTVTSLVIDSDNPSILHSSSLDRSVCTFDLRQNRRLVNHASSSKMHCSYTCLTQKTTGFLETISGSSDGVISFWDKDYTDPIFQFQIENITPIRSIDVNPLKGNIIASVGDDGVLRIWNIQESEGHVRGVQLISEVCIHSSPILSVKWSPDQRQLVTVAGDGSIGVWSWFLE